MVRYSHQITKQKQPKQRFYLRFFTGGFKNECYYFCLCRSDEFSNYFPAFENGHEVRLVGSPLDRDIIDGLKKDNFHITLKRTLHDGIKYYQIEELEEALKGADLVLGGVSKFWT